MKGVIVALALVATALVPVAAAVTTVCTPSPVPGYNCVTAGGYSYGSGTCQSSSYHYEQNVVNVYSYGSPAGYTSVNGGNYCYAYSFWGYTFNGEAIYASAYNSNVGYAGASWSAWSGSFGSGCQTSGYAYTAATGYRSTGPLGCPAGTPPDGIPVLP